MQFRENNSLFEIKGLEEKRGRGRLTTINPRSEANSVFIKTGKFIKTGMG